MRLPLLFAATALWAQQSGVIKTETRVVLVDTIVTGKNGESVSDLTSKDFKVWEDNKEQTLTGVTLETASSANAPTRYLVLFFDSAAIQSGDSIQVQRSVSSFIDANVGPNRLISLVDYNGGLRVAQKFTDNAGRLKDALKTVNSSGGARDSTSAAADLRTRDMLRTLADLSRSLSALPGRKILVLLTGAMAPSSDQRFVMGSTLEAANMSGVAIYPVDVRPASSLRIGGKGLMTADASGPQDPGDAPAPSPRTRGRAQAGPQEQAADARANAQDSGSQEILYALANGTGGFVIKNSSTMVGELPEIGKEQDQYYVLSYTPPESKEGSCHTLKVKVDRSHTTVRSRSNYCTVKPLDLLAGTTAGKDLETRAASSQAGNITASMQLPYFYDANGVARVTVAMEMIPDKPHAEINLLGIASTPDGGVAARFSDVVKFSLDDQKGRALHYEKEFKIAPGRYTFTMAFGSGSASFGKSEMQLNVDPWKPGDVALSGIVLSREVHPANQLDLGLATALTGANKSFVVDGMQVIPSGSTVFKKSEPAFFHFEVYGPNSVAAHIRFLDRKTGVEEWDSGLVNLMPHQGGNIPTGMLDPGSYQIEVAAESGIKRTADFDIQ